MDATAQLFPLLALAGAAFVAGLLGATHCVSMCGGIAGAIQAAQRPVPVTLHRSRGAFLLAAVKRALPFNAGRIASYTGAGALAGALGAGWTQAFDLQALREGLFVAANFMLVVLGVSLAAGLRFAVLLERWGGVVWAGLRPVAARLAASRTPAHGVAIGLLWGFMPCALVYAMLLSALTSGSALQGGVLLLAFGLGTLPGMLGAGLAWSLPLAGAAHDARRRRYYKLALGLGIAAFGVAGFLHLPLLAAPLGLGGVCH